MLCSCVEVRVLAEKFSCNITVKGSERSIDRSMDRSARPEGPWERAIGGMGPKDGTQGAHPRGARIERSMTAARCARSAQKMLTTAYFVQSFEAICSRTSQIVLEGISRGYHVGIT